MDCITKLNKSNHTNLFSSSFLSKQWPLCGPCQLQDRSGREWSCGATVHFCVSGRLILPFLPTIALPFEASDCCGWAQGSCRRDIQSCALLLILQPTDHGTTGRTSAPTRIGHHRPMNPIVLGLNAATSFDLAKQWEPKKSQHEHWESKHILWLFMWDGRKKQQA